MFVNEHRRETYVARQPGESANDRNDRAVRRAAQWLREEHFVIEEGKENAGDAVKRIADVVLITDDKECRRK